jgi:hypothetical protein
MANEAHGCLGSVGWARRFVALMTLLLSSPLVVISMPLFPILSDWALWGMATAGLGQLGRFLLHEPHILECFCVSIFFVHLGKQLGQNSYFHFAFDYMALGEF